MKIEKEWAAVKGDRILAKGETKRELRRRLEESPVDYHPDEYEIIALPKNPPPSLI